MEMRTNGLGWAGAAHAIYCSNLVGADGLYLDVRLHNRNSVFSWEGFMIKWQYCVRWVINYPAMEMQDLKDTTETLNELGAKGWECFAVCAEVMYFKRELNKVRETK